MILQYDKDIRSKLFVPTGGGWDFFFYECLLCTWQFLQWRGDWSSGWEDFGVSQEGATNSQEGNILNLWMIITLATLPWSAGRAGLFCSVQKVLSLQLSSDMALLEKVGLCCYNRCVGLAADAVHFPGSAKPATCLKI